MAKFQKKTPQPVIEEDPIGDQSAEAFDMQMSEEVEEPKVPEETAPSEEKALVQALDEADKKSEQTPPEPNPVDTKDDKEGQPTEPVKIPVFKKSSLNQPKENPVQNTDVLSCPQCGATLAKDAEFCPHCGKQIQTLPKKNDSEEITKECPVCHTHLPDKANYCLECGHPFISVQAPDDEKIILSENVMELSDQKCPECGARRLKDTQYCYKCGHHYLPTKEEKKLTYSEEKKRKGLVGAFVTCLVLGILALGFSFVLYEVFVTQVDSDYKLIILGNPANLAAYPGFLPIYAFTSVDFEVRHYYWILGFLGLSIVGIVVAALKLKKPAVKNVLTFVLMTICFAYVAYALYNQSMATIEFIKYDAGSRGTQFYQSLLSLPLGAMLSVVLFVILFIVLFVNFIVSLSVMIRDFIVAGRRKKARENK
ncbi:MAG: zinc ribbon domain-containing protein [Bacilli bacterium]|nr:zinc ribbon domain-containing protein [Bacilli bacterium]